MTAIKVYYLLLRLSLEMRIMLTNCKITQNSDIFYDKTFQHFCQYC